ncbi:hypothetical protein FUSNEC_GEN_11281_08965 [Fusobacterium necrophorum subsp. funduliforme]|uniref:hypothetical protein n=1 Tax=Fusobacterium necrophorum TaxID=859 RepID=UPI00254C602E|nr:hypothetical protein [Fusobacterium necrophorum]MDK4484744.1 hypothetical protein [Fusobacterium necrophorum]
MDLSFQDIQSSRIKSDLIYMILTFVKEHNYEHRYVFFTPYGYVCGYVHNILDAQSNPDKFLPPDMNIHQLVARIRQEITGRKFKSKCPEKALNKNFSDFDFYDFVCLTDVYMKHHDEERILLKSHILFLKDVLGFSLITEKDFSRYF